MAVGGYRDIREIICVRIEKKKGNGSSTTEEPQKMYREMIEHVHGGRM